MEGRSFGLDVLRTLSVWMVMLSHVAYWFNPSSDGVYYSLIKPVMLGVEPFFVLGGFLAALSFQHVLEKKNGRVEPGDAGVYIKRRWLRTFPNYFLFLLIYFLAFSAVKPDFEFDPKYLFFAQNFYWLAPSFFSISWSLATQEWFYIALPVLMVLASVSLPGRFRINPLLAGSLALIAISFIARYQYLQMNTVTNLEGELRRIALLRLDSVGIGVLMGYCYFRWSEWLDKNGFKLLLLGILMVVIFSFLRRTEEFNQIYWVQMLFYPLFSTMIALWMPWLYKLPTLASGALVWIFENTSKWSYSIYLSHVFFLDGIYLVGRKLGLTFELNIFVVGLTIAWILVTYIASATIYRFYEKPWLKYARSDRQSTAQKMPKAVNPE